MHTAIKTCDREKLIPTHKYLFISLKHLGYLSSELHPQEITRIDFVASDSGNQMMRLHAVKSLEKILHVAACKQHKGFFL